MTNLFLKGPTDDTMAPISELTTFNFEYKEMDGGGQNGGMVPTTGRSVVLHHVPPL